MDTTNSSFPEAVVQVLREEGLLNARDTEQAKVIRFAHPAQLQIVQRSVDTGHPHFYNQLYAGTDPYGLAGTWVSEALNTNQYTFEVAPAFSLAEHAVLQRALRLFKFPHGDGIFSPGGSISNMYALVLARYKMVPQVKTEGVCGEAPLVAFTSEDAHYSMLKGAHWLGLGTRNVVRVKTDARGCMEPAHLEQCIVRTRREGSRPFIVIATAGTTILGSFDPLEAIANVCQKNKLWLHVDACWGGSLLLSSKHAHHLAGIERVDSVSWNPHKMLGAPLQCSLLLVKEEGLLHKCNSASATYLFQQDKFYDTSFDSGDKSVQCGRKTDAYKLWLMWRARGDKGLGFELVLPEFQCTNVCFWFIPESMRDEKRDDLWWEKLSK
ncbi:hypothetical protein B566_EDAN006783, partial [Ephemera danica]